ncbi:hypothetical protein R5R73_01265 [Salinicola sp. LHM]|uniref:SDH family Clp fold serine proteinase n=1 Tax=Salinicola sp. LHM TaxID=3065298 RepID=UPI002ACE2115|nr:hypothetical protein [Salinicola sp. LHM]WQH33356.1 hypothetical protein R5R73_01265 [Salinicola sp. LHM]
MPSWNQILAEMVQAKDNGSKSALDDVRKKYITRLHEHTGRNVICYYSAFMKNGSLPHLGINDNDKNSLMATVHEMDFSKGLDLIMHTPGGSVTAAESIIHYLNEVFDGDVRAIIPQAAFSAGTMIACGCKSIVMGKQSSLGPFDPHLGNYSCHNIIDELEEISGRIKDAPHEAMLWRPILEKLDPTLYLQCKHSIDLATSIVEHWLQKVMLKEVENKEEIARSITSKLNKTSHTKDHSRHIHIHDAEEMGLIIERLEEDQDLQDLVLSVHHSYMILIGESHVTKIVENQIGATQIMVAN